MTREIKFRAWDKAQKKMWVPKDFIHGPMGIFEVDVTIVGDECILMQCTGLKDKNGLDIFEGDILSDWNDCDGEQIQSFMQVFWCEKDGAWKLDNSFNNDKSSGDLLSEELSSFVYEITGNIYENPGLLTK